MVLVKGLDRTDNEEDPLKDMPDDLWREHTSEIQREFLLLPENTMTFKAFCYRYYIGEATTSAMRIYATQKDEVGAIKQEES